MARHNINPSPELRQRCACHSASGGGLQHPASDFANFNATCSLVFLLLLDGTPLAARDAMNATVALRAERQRQAWRRA